MDTDLEKIGEHRAKRSHFIKIRVTADEKKIILKNADGVRLKPSTFLRSLGIGYEPHSTLDQSAILELLKASNRISKLGSLLKMWLTNDERLHQISAADINHLWDELQTAKTKLQEKVREL